MLDQLLKSTLKGDGIVGPPPSFGEPEAAALAFEFAPAMMGVVEPVGDGDILHVCDNQAACAFFGVPAGFTAGRHATSLGATVETIRYWMSHYRASAEQGRPVAFEDVHQTAAGELWLSVVVRPLGTGPSGRARFMYVAQDITGRKQAEPTAERAELRATDSGRALRAERDLSTAILDVSGALVIVFARSGRIARFKRTCEVTSGRSAQDVRGQQFWDMGFIPSEEVAGARATWNDLLEGQFSNTHDVDDNADNTDTLAMLLETLGSEVARAYDGEHALELVTFAPTVLLLDLGMPRLSGYEVCRRVRELPGGRDIYVVAMTGWGQADDRRRTADAGFDAHLVKPVAPSAIIALLASRP